MNDLLNSFNKELCMNLILVALQVGLLFRIFGIPVELLIGLVGLLKLDLVVGVYISLFHRKQKFEPGKFGRFFIKLFVLLAIICLLNQLKVGFGKMVTDLAYVEFIVNFSLDSAFVFFMFGMSVFTLASVIQNYAETGNPFFVMMANYMKLKIKKVEDFAIEK